MPLIDPTALTTFLVGIGIACLAAILIAVVAIAVTLRATRGDRKDRHESIPVYYGRLHFAH